MTRKRRLTGDWKSKAERLGELLPRERLHRSVLAWAERDGRSGLRRWAAAFSGGPDSLALMLLLWAHWPERRSRLVALHFNHRLRGSASDGDERFCRHVCESLGVRIVVGSWDEGRRGASEEEARNARFAFFDRAMAKSGARALWLGHQQNDIAESMLMRLARGSGTGGLAAPRPVQRVGRHVRLRPLLTIRKEEVLELLTAIGIPWREDGTNAGKAYFRNRVRHSVLPVWQKAAGRDVVAAAALARERLEEDDDALDSWLEELRPWNRGGSLNLDVLRKRPIALARRALHRWLLAQPLAGELSRQGFDDLLGAMMSGARTRRSLGCNGFALIRDGRLSFARDRKSGRKHPIATLRKSKH